MNTVKLSAQQAKAPTRKEGDTLPKAGIETPLKVSFKEDQILGEYMNVAVHTCKEHYPITELVVSHHIGKTNNVLMEKAWVVNRRKDVVDLIRGARDPDKGRIQAAQKQKELDFMVKKEYVERAGDSYLITKKCSAKLSGHEYDHYLDRAQQAFQSAKKDAEEKHQEEQAKKQPRFRRKFHFDKEPADFYTDDERAAHTAIQAARLDPELQEQLRKEENTGYETLINGEYPQKPLYLGGTELSQYKLTDIAHNMDKYLMSVLTPQKAGVTPPAKATEYDVAIKVRDEVMKKLKESEAKLETIHKYYGATTLLSEKNTKIQSLENEIIDLKEQLDTLEQEMGEPWKDRFLDLERKLLTFKEPPSKEAMLEVIKHARDDNL